MATRANLQAILRGQNVYVEGIGFLGRVGEIEPPKVEFEMVEDGNMGRKVDTGLLKPMETKITILDLNPVLYEAVGKRLRETASVVIKRSVASNKKEEQVYFEVSGHIETEESEGKEVGKETGTVLTVSVVTYKLELGGTEMYDIDTDNYVCKINGVDKYETLRKQL